VLVDLKKNDQSITSFLVFLNAVTKTAKASSSGLGFNAGRNSVALNPR
jgi:hypothetical protein